MEPNKTTAKKRGPLSIYFLHGRPPPPCVIFKISRGVGGGGDIFPESGPSLYRPLPAGQPKGKPRNVLPLEIIITNRQVQ